MFSTAVKIGFLGLLLCCYSSVGKAQTATTLKIGASLLESVIVEAETDLEVIFTEGKTGAYVVNSQLEDGDLSLLRPATVRITGNPVEMMIDIEAKEIFSSEGDQGDIVVISDFNFGQEGAGSSVSIMPYSDDDSFLLTIGGTVSGVMGVEKFYTGQNVLSINYL